MRCLVLPLLLSASALTAQVPELKLARPDARYDRELSSITGLLELPDGQLLVSDGLDETLLRINLSTGKTDTVSRTGAGPGEYKGPDLLFGMPSGGFLLVELGNSRLSFFDAGFKYRESTPIARGTPGAGLTMLIPDGVDASGRIYFRSIMRAAEGPPDSGAVVRWNRVGDKFDTLTKVKLSETRMSSSGGPNNRSVSMRPVPLSPEDVWAVAPDGRIVVVRASDYRVEWIQPGGAVTRGPANQWRPVPIRETDKQEWRDQLRTTGLSTQVTAQDGRMSVRMGRGIGANSPMSRSDDLEWPDAKPSIRLVRVSPEGEAWVERHVPAGTPRTFDVFGPDARLRRRVVLPAKRELIGFGKGVVYLRERTEDDLVYLERYRLN
jgi:hypothetical protein